MMGLKDIHSDTKGVIALAQTPIEGALVNSQVIDMLGFEALEFFMTFSANGDGNFDVSLIHGELADLSDGVAVPAEYVLGNLLFLSTDVNVVKRVGYIGHKRYCRIRVTPTSLDTTGTIRITAVKANPLHGPVLND